MSLGIRTNFEYHVPKSLDEALELLAQYGGEARPIAGGTDLIPKIKSGVMEFSHLISLKEVDELRNTYIDEDGALHLAACTTIRETEAFPGVRETWPALWEAMHSMANTQVRNRGTVVGNICNAVPSSENGPALIVYGASVVLQKKGSVRVVPVTDFFTGVLQTVVQPDELVTEIVVPKPAEGASSVYYKYALRKALDLAMVGVASCVLLDGDGVVKEARLGLGAVAVVPKRAYNAEEHIIGKKLTGELIDEAAEIASQQDCKPITDIRATAGYRREMVRIHVRDALRLAAGL